ncbi:MAG TPA: hypothetical protein VMA71_00345 [Alloacidobacterium sp.]|nr:hypothetical protein [Alloacidobacterium sp.]
MNHFGAGHRTCQDGEDPFSRVVYGLGIALLMFGIFVPGAHTLMMVGLALLAIAYVV